MKERVGVKSLEQGFHRSRLPELTHEEIDYIRGSSDIFGLNHYSSLFIYRNESVYGSFPSPSLQDDLEVIMFQTDDMQIGESEKVKVIKITYKYCVCYYYTGTLCIIADA